MGPEGGRNNAYTKKAKFFLKSPVDFYLQVIAQNCVKWPPSFREVGKCNCVDEYIVAPTNQLLKKKGLKVILRQLGVTDKLTNQIFRAVITLGCTIQIQSKGQLQIHLIPNVNYDLVFYCTLRHYFPNTKRDCGQKIINAKQHFGFEDPGSVDGGRSEGKAALGFSFRNDICF